MKNFTSFLLISILLLTTVGCYNNRIPNTYIHKNPGHLTQQAESYLKTASNTLDLSKKNNLLLYSSELLIEDNNYLWAEKILAEVNDQTLSPSQYAYLQILLARISLSHKNITHAKELLANLGSYQNLEEDIYKKLHLTKIDIFLQSGDILEAVQEQIRLEPYLYTTEQKLEIQKNIWHNLQQLTPNSLEMAEQHNFDNNMQGWISIAIITKRYDADQKELSKALELWQQNFPNHPANTILNLSKKTSTKEHQKILNNKLNKIALLLPLSGSYKQNGLAIKNGFLSALYNQKSESQKPKVIILDTNDNAINAVYNKAVNLGVDFIVGPLIRKDLETLIKTTTLSIPVLALNNLQDNKLYSNLLFQFGLPLDTESIAISEKAKENHHKNALLIIQNNEYGQKILTNLAKNWKENGGNIINTIYIDNKTEVNEELKTALGIKDSENRAKALSNLGIKITFEPRRRQDIDCIFLITNAEYARQIKPLLNFYYASKIPVYAASNIYTGIKNTLDRDLEHIQFCDMPWMLDNAIHSRIIHQSIKKLWGKDFAQYSRFYALGIDAYKIVTQLEQLLSIPEIGISGMTGILKINANNIIHRKLTWGTFENGTAVVLHNKI